MTPIVGFAPDSDPVTEGILTDCQNLLPFEAGFIGAPSAVAVAAGVLAAECRGAVVATRLDGTRRVFAGTQTKLYELSGSSWVDRTVGGATYSGSAESRWSFCQFGDTTVATNLTDAMQSSTSGAFNPITGAPKAKIVISAANNFVLAFNTNDATYGQNTDRWWCCAQNDQTSWTPNVSTGATTGRLIAVEGPIQAALPLGDYVVAYKQRAIFRGVYAGGSIVWQWNLVPGGEAGAVGPEAVCDIGGAHFIVGNDNFWIFDGTRPIPVGVGVIRQWFLNNSSPTYRYRTKVSYDRQKSLVSVYYPSLNSDGTCDSRLVFHVGTKHWGRADVVAQAPLNFIAPGVTINALDTVAATINTLPNIPLDAQYWASGGQVACYFDSTNQLVSLTGSSLSSSFTTGDIGDDDQVTMVDRLRLRWTLAPVSAVASAFYKMTSGSGLSTGPTNALNDGKFDLRQSGRWHRFRVDMTGDHKLTAFAVKPVPVGQR
jgi:hypothetical protein